MAIMEQFRVRTYIISEEEQTDIYTKGAISEAELGRKISSLLQQKKFINVVIDRYDGTKIHYPSVMDGAV